MNIELIVFDIAGTTVADAGNINQTFKDAFLVAGIYVATNDIDAVMGYKKIQAVEIIINKYLPDFDGNRKDLINHIHEVFTYNMVKFYENSTNLKPLPNVLDVFSWLKAKGIKIALNTGFTRVITNAILQKLNWVNSPFIDTVVCSDEVDAGRPAPYMINKIMQQLNIINPKKVIKVGDTEVDINEGKNAGCLFSIGVTTGAFTHQQLAVYQPSYIINNMNELILVIQNYL